MSFDAAVQFVLEREGGYVNDHRDNGGETKYGISKRSYPNLDIKALTIDQAKEIYKRDYWDKLPSDIPDGLAFHVFSCMVNCGSYRAIRLLQSAVGATVDGVWGINSQQLLAKLGEREAIKRFCCAWIMFYAGTDDFKVYGKGWINRVIEGLMA